MSIEKWAELNRDIMVCKRCSRLVEWREEVAKIKRRAYQDWDYWGKPVPGFGDHKARIMVVGLAPGAHGSNRTGRMFTGDASGDFLFPALYRAGFANQPNAEHREDDLTLKDIFITAVGRCTPPANKPSRQELVNCQPFLLREMDLLHGVEGVVALGKIAFDSILNTPTFSAYKYTKSKFSHGAYYKISDAGPGFWLPTIQAAKTHRQVA